MKWLTFTLWFIKQIVIEMKRNRRERKREKIRRIADHPDDELERRGLLEGSSEGTVLTNLPHPPKEPQHPEGDSN